MSLVIQSNIKQEAELEFLLLLVPDRDSESRIQVEPIKVESFKELSVKVTKCEINNDEANYTSAQFNLEPEIKYEELKIAVNCKKFDDDWKTKGKLYKNYVSCMKCKFMTTNEIDLELHEKSHKQKNFKCDLCSATYVHKYDLKSHLIKNHLGITQELAQIDGFSWPEKPIILKKSIKIDNAVNDRKFKCDLCSYAGRGKVNLIHYAQIHMKKN
jgi:hypothetical protein